MYQGITPYYDEIFPLQAEDLRFFGSLLQDKKRILDIGCGTGKAAAILARSDREVTGIDLNPAMIERAEAGHSGPGIRFEVLDMTLIGQRFAPASFDGALCLGNTLVHLTDHKVLQDFLNNMHSVLAPGGIGLIQILNYARICERGIRELPLIETPLVRFARRYEPEGDRLRFVTRLEVKATDDGADERTSETIEDSVLLLPLRPTELEKMLRQAGFSHVDLYGDFSGGPLKDDSFVSVAGFYA